MHRCLSTLGCPDFTLDATLALAARHDIDAIEIRALGGTVELPRYFAERFGTPAELAAQMRGATVRVAALDTSLKLVGAAEGDREAFLAYVPWAEALGARWLRVFDGGKIGDATELAAMAETVRWWRDVRRANGWAADIFIETHDSLFTADAINRFRSRAPGTAILWDSHHTWKKGGEDPVATWRAIRDGVVHVHVKDSVSVPSAKHPFTYVRPGGGEFPIAPLLAALRADGFDGLVSLEWERLWHPYLPPLDEALAAARTRGWW